MHRLCYYTMSHSIIFYIVICWGHSVVDDKSVIVVIYLHVRLMDHFTGIGINRRIINRNWPLYLAVVVRYHRADWARLMSTVSKVTMGKSLHTVLQWKLPWCRNRYQPSHGQWPPSYINTTMEYLCYYCDCLQLCRLAIFQMTLPPWRANNLTLPVKLVTVDCKQYSRGEWGSIICVGIAREVLDHCCVSICSRFRRRAVCCHSCDNRYSFVK